MKYLLWTYRPVHFFHNLFDRKLPKDVTKRCVLYSGGFLCKAFGAQCVSQVPAACSVPCVQLV